MKDINKNYTKSQVAAKLRRLADALESDKSFSIQVAGHKVYVPRDATAGVEYEHSKGEHELELQVRWEK